jgi:hypothetical protein
VERLLWERAVLYDQLSLYHADSPRLRTTRACQRAPEGRDLLGGAVSKRHTRQSRQTSRQKRKSFARASFPGAFGKPPAALAALAKKALQVCGATGDVGMQRGNGAASSARRDIHGYGDQELHVVRMTGRMPLARPLLGAGQVWPEKMTQVRSAHTATATPKDGRLSCTARQT